MLTDDQIGEVCEIMYAYADEKVMAAANEAAWNTIVNTQCGREGYAAELKAMADEHRRKAHELERELLYILDQANK